MSDQMPGHPVRSTQKINHHKGASGFIWCSPFCQSMNPCGHLSSINPRKFTPLLHIILVFIRVLLIRLQRQIKCRLKSENVDSRYGILKAKVAADRRTVVHTQLALVPKGEQSPSRERQCGPYPDSDLWPLSAAAVTGRGR